MVRKIALALVDQNPFRVTPAHSNKNNDAAIKMLLEKVAHSYRLLLAFSVLAVSLAAAPAHAQTFSDVPPSNWAYSFIETFADSGITGSCGGGRYCPEQPVSRAQMAVFLVRVFGLGLTQQAFVKASHSDPRNGFGRSVSLSRDGATLAVGAAGEDSNATGINGDQLDNSAQSAGAAYVLR